MKAHKDDESTQYFDVTSPADATRRDFLSKTLLGCGAGVLAGWLPAFRVDAAHALPHSLPGTGFPPGISLFRQAFRNWSGEIRVSDAWTCTPRTENEVVDIVNWAWKKGYKVRPRGMSHNWSPLIFPTDRANTGNVLLVDTTQLTSIKIDATTTPATVTAQTGIQMQSLMEQLEVQGLGFVATPAPGDLTLGGVLAIGGHGTGVRADGEIRQPGQTFGSISNTVLALTALVWDVSQNRYALKTFRRFDPECGAFLVHLGRAFVLSATLQIGKNQRLRCRSHVDISSDELFAQPGSSGRTMGSFVKSHGRVEAIWFPFTKKPWLKVWSISPTKPRGSRETGAPFNYAFSDNIPLEISNLVAIISTRLPGLTPLLGAKQLAVVTLGLLTTHSSDIWGWSKNSLLYIKPTTLRVTANGYAIITSRANVQQVIYDFVEFYTEMVRYYQKSARFPMNGPVEIRVTGLDDPSDVAVDNAAQPWLSAIRPNKDHPEWDTAIWLDILTVPGTRYSNAFFSDIEAWIFSHYTGNYAQARVEWSKGWAYRATGAWANREVLETTVPNSLRIGQSRADNWDAAAVVLSKYDPGRIYTSPLLEQVGL
jgi:FAD/FMN-containing dehydrogenase